MKYSIKCTHYIAKDTYKSILIFDIDSYSLPFMITTQKFTKAKARTATLPIRYWSIDIEQTKLNRE